MSLVALDGHGFWLPLLWGYGYATSLLGPATLLTLDADEEEGQVIGTVSIAGGGSKTFGTSSKIGWMPGAITFAAGATLSVGLKGPNKVDAATGPPARATPGAAAFDMARALVGGTDTLTANTWREETMTTGTPLTVTHGDLIAVCFHLDVASGTPSVIVRGISNSIGVSGLSLPDVTLVTTGPTYAAQTNLSNLVLVFDDGAVGWIEPTKVMSSYDATTSTIGSGNRLGNIVQLPMPCQIDGLAASLGSAAGDFALDVMATPLGTPTVLATVACDANVLASSSTRLIVKTLPTPITLTANTPYAIALRQTTATGITGAQYDVADTTHFKANGFPGTCYAAISTAGAAFVAQNSQRRRYLIYMRVCALDDGAGGAAAGGGAVFGSTGGVIA